MGTSGPLQRQGFIRLFMSGRSPLICAASKFSTFSAGAKAHAAVSVSCK
jgi:hypothetical protein